MIRVSYSLNPDQARHFVRPDLGPNCFAKVLSRRHKELKGTATLRANESEMQALIKLCNLPQTQSKSDIKLESYRNLKIKIMNGGFH